MLISQAAVDEVVTWAEGLSAIGAVVTPLVVAVVGYLLSRRLKAIEDEQRRDQALTQARLGYYREIAEPLNDLLCWFTFIGSWKDRTPPEVVALKRSLDRTFHTLSPLFGPDVARAYDDFMGRTFMTFGRWGADACLKTTARRRRDVYPMWDPSWDELFAYPEGTDIPPTELEEIKRSYNEVLAHLVDDIRLLAARTDYANARVVLNA